MNLSKAKTILIIAFLLTDLFLIFTYGLSFRSGDEITNEQVKAFLSEKNIYVDLEIPREHKDMPVLWIQHETLGDSQMEELLQAQMPLPQKENGDETYLEAAETFLSDAGLMEENVTFSKVERTSGGAVVSFENRKDGWKVEDSKIRCVFQGDRMVALQYDWLHIEGKSKSKRSTISANEALIIFMGKNIGEKTYVEDIEMVYWLNKSEFNATETISDTALPAWKIVYNDGKVEYIDAYEQK